MKIRFIIALICMAAPIATFSQDVEKVFFNPKDSASGYYLAIKPSSGDNKGVLILLRGFQDPERISPETNLPDVASANGFLTILASTEMKFYADTVAVERLNQIVSHVIQKYAPDTSRFAIGGYDIAGTIVLRYAELAKEGVMGIPVIPKAVFAIDSPVDLFNFWDRCEEQIKKNFYGPAVGDARFILDRMRSENGDIRKNIMSYKKLSPVYVRSDEPGNEQFLRNMGVRIYFDTDINWYLLNRRNGFNDTNIPDGSELVKRLLLAGNENAQFVSSRPGMRSNGTRNPSSISIVDEMDCVRWLKKSLGIFDPNNWTRPHHIEVPKDWDTELLALPPDFATSISHKGVEELFFEPGWSDSHSDGYWTYAYWWWLDEKQVPDENVLKNDLKAYYDGLVGRNIKPRNIPENLIIPTQVNIKKGKSNQTYNGTISMLDYMSQKPIVLNFTIQVKKCSQSNGTALFFEISPKPLDHPVWKKMEDVITSFRCEL